MNILVTCPECFRHVRHSDVACPFCGASGPRPDGGRQLERLGRAALLTFSAASGLIACSGASGSANGAAVAAPERSPVSSTVPPSPSPVKRESPATSEPAPPPTSVANTAAAYGGPPLPPNVPIAAPAPPARVEIGALSVTGGTIPNVEGVVSGMRTGFETCVARGQSTHPETEGQVTLTIRLGGAGQILGVAAQQTAKVPATVVSCMTTRAAASQFEPPAGAKGQVSLVVPVTLTKR